MNFSQIQYLLLLIFYIYIYIYIYIYNEFYNLMKLIILFTCMMNITSLESFYQG
jgi:hypothetical protein